MIKPLGERVVIEVAESDVIAVGTGKLLDNGQRATPEVKVGDGVVFSKYSGSEIKVDDKDYLIVRESDILAIL